MTPNETVWFVVFVVFVASLFSLLVIIGMVFYFKVQLATRTDEYTHISQKFQVLLNDYNTLYVYMKRFDCEMPKHSSIVSVPTCGTAGSIRHDPKPMTIQAIAAEMHRKLSQEKAHVIPKAREHDTIHAGATDS